MIVSINSPGGSVSATYNLYHILYDFKINNDVKIFFHTNELLASGGYWVALASDKIYANYGSLIGSIGVRGPDWIYFDTPIAISKGLLGESIETKKELKNLIQLLDNLKIYLIHSECQQKKNTALFKIWLIIFMKIL